MSMMVLDFMVQGNTIDDNYKTTWQEDNAGPRIGESITLDFEKEVEFNALALYLGHWNSEELWYINDSDSVWVIH